MLKNPRLLLVLCVVIFSRDEMSIFVKGWIILLEETVKFDELGGNFRIAVGRNKSMKKKWSSPARCVDAMHVNLVNISRDSDYACAFLYLDFLNTLQTVVNQSFVDDSRDRKIPIRMRSSVPEEDHCVMLARSLRGL